MRNFDSEDQNYLLVTSRMTKGESFRHVAISDGFVEAIFLSSKTSNNAIIFPLYVLPKNNSQEQLFRIDQEMLPNMSDSFIKALSEKLGLHFLKKGRGDLEKTLGPENVLHYFYAILHSKSYRSRYSEFLKRDFPRIPITSDRILFGKLCSLGDKLVILHLMKSDKLNDHITTFPISGDNTVTKVGETGKKLKDVEGGKGKLYLNSTQYFENLPEEVWQFHIGGYQVCQKWLADRKKAGRKLSADDIEHYHKIVVALNETIKIMAKIDEVIDAHGGWPIK